MSTFQGGPGGSGVDFVARAGPALQLLTGGRYDMIGFDPRGVGQTKPAFR
jgi:pimeloyl-ACP methyl ester carboxylesterase